MKKNIYFICFLVVLAVYFVITPVMAYNWTCNCTNQSMVVVSDKNTTYTRIPFDGWHPIFTIPTAQQHPIWSQITMTSGTSPAKWIWANNNPGPTYNNGPFIFRRQFGFNNSCCLVNLNATINITADDAFVLRFNDQYIGWGYMPEGPGCGALNPPNEYSFSIPTNLLHQVNEINITAQNHALPCDPTPNHAGVIYRLNITYDNCCPNWTVFNPSSPVTVICGNSLPQDLPDSTNVVSPLSTPAPLWPFSIFLSKQSQAETI